MMDKHLEYMRECLRLAKKGEGMVSPNPLVGAVLVRGGKIIGRGYHRRFGGPHAEVECLRLARGPVAGSTLYVNLEPCSHHGKTPPCVDLIVRSGIGSVVIATQDPNPRVSGRGIRRLRAAGIGVEVGVLEEEARDLNKAFFLHITRRRPYVHLKIAQTLDGMIASASGKPGWISSKESRVLVHGWRAEYDAVLVGVGTVIADDPRLTVRLKKGRHPATVVLDGALEIPETAAIFRADRDVFIISSAMALRRKRNKAKKLERQGVILLRMEGSGHAFNLRQALKSLYEHGVGSVLVEGGREVFSQFLRHGPVDELSLFVAPTVMGHGIPAVTNVPGERSSVRFTRWSAMPVGRDILIQAFR
jgi:diaminohydroxyphosphoribosylaminopyrimidine deaminase / 5-amino-6-(5-phosphoribosylamino)uracil reductase